MIVVLVTLPWSARPHAATTSRLQTTPSSHAETRLWATSSTTQKWCPSLMLRSVCRILCCVHRLTGDWLCNLQHATFPLRLDATPRALRAPATSLASIPCNQALFLSSASPWNPTADPTFPSRTTTGLFFLLHFLTRHSRLLLTCSPRLDNQDNQGFGFDETAPRYAVL